MRQINYRTINIPTWPVIATFCVLATCIGFVIGAIWGEDLIVWWVL